MADYHTSSARVGCSGIKSSSSAVSFSSTGNPTCKSWIMMLRFETLGSITFALRHISTRICYKASIDRPKAADV